MLRLDFDMLCTIIICTRDRATQLAAVLSSLCALDVPVGLAWDVLIVDNASSDDTPAVVASFAERLPVRRVIAPVPGLSRARNVGIAAARGRYILWTDDDVLLDRHWLTSYLAAFKKHPEATVFGGKVVPLLEEPAPRWFSESSRDLVYLLAHRDFGPAELPLDLARDRIPYGANFAMRTAEQRRYPYDPELGVAPGRRRGGEETAVIKAMLRDGLEGWWVPGAAVQHVIPAARQTRDYVWRFYESMGEAWAHGMGLHRAPLTTWAKIPVAFVRFKIAETLRLRSRIRYLTSLSYHYGAWKYFRSHRPSLHDRVG